MEGYIFFGHRIALLTYGYSLNEASWIDRDIISEFKIGYKEKIIGYVTGFFIVPLQWHDKLSLKGML